jgi:hypothetical protein
MTCAADAGSLVGVIWAWTYKLSYFCLMTFMLMMLGVTLSKARACWYISVHIIPFTTALNQIFSGHEPCKCKSMNTFCQLSTLTGSLCPSFRSDFVWELLNSLGFLADWAFHWASPIVCSDLMQVTDDGPHVIQDHLSRQKLRSTWIRLIEAWCVFLYVMMYESRRIFVELAGSRYWNHWNWGGPELYVNAG